MTVTSSTTNCTSRSLGGTAMQQAIRSVGSNIALVYHDLRFVGLPETGFASKILAISVGPEKDKQCFMVHEEMFSSRSSVIRRAARVEIPGHTGAEPPMLVLESQNECAFRLYVNFVYSGRIMMSRKSLLDIWLSLVDMHNLTEFLDDPPASLCTVKAMETFVDATPRGIQNGSLGTSSTLRPFFIEQLYKRITTAQSQARILMVNLFCRKCSTNLLISGKKKWPKSLLYDVALRLMESDCQRSPIMGDAADLTNKRSQPEDTTADILASATASLTLSSLST